MAYSLRAANARCGLRMRRLQSLDVIGLSASCECALRTANAQAAESKRNWPTLCELRMRRLQSLTVQVANYVIGVANYGYKC